MSFVPEGFVTRRPCILIKLTETREITRYKWVHPDEDR
jgi:hypothetical protein